MAEPKKPVRSTLSIGRHRDAGFTVRAKTGDTEWNFEGASRTEMESLHAALYDLLRCRSSLVEIFFDPPPQLDSQWMAGARAKAAAIDQRHFDPVRDFIVAPLRA